MRRSQLILLFVPRGARPRRSAKYAGKQSPEFTRAPGAAARLRGGGVGRIQLA